MSTESSTEQQTTRARRPRGFVVAVVLFVVCAAAAGGLGASWALAANDDSVAFAVERNQVMEDGRQAILNFNTLDHKDVQKGFDRWVASSTGPLREEVERGRDQNAQQIQQAKTSTEAEVVDAALTELDRRAGKAKMIAVVKVVQEREGQQPSEKRSRYEAELTREGEQWKLSGLGPVAVG